MKKFIYYLPKTKITADKKIVLSHFAKKTAYAETKADAIAQIKQNLPAKNRQMELVSPGAKETLFDRPWMT